MTAAVLSHGIDIVEVARIERLWQQHGARFLDRVYTPAEQEYCIQGKVGGVRLSGRFAAKEAVLKVLGTGWRGGIEWTDIEVLPDPLGKPLCELKGRTLALATRIGIRDVLVSISHAGGFATASALGCGAAGGSGATGSDWNPGI